MRYIIDGNKAVNRPVLETDSFLIQSLGPFKLDMNGNIMFEVVSVPFGHWIGSNHRRTMKLGHFKKPESYYKRRNTPKHLRIKNGNSVNSGGNSTATVLTV